MVGIKPSVLATGDLFSVVASTPAVQALREGVEKGKFLSLDAVSPAAHPFLAVLLSSLFPDRPIIVVAQNLKTQEVFQQDIQTWLAHLPPPNPNPNPNLNLNLNLNKSPPPTNSRKEAPKPQNLPPLLEGEGRGEDYLPLGAFCAALRFPPISSPSMGKP